MANEKILVVDDEEDILDLAIVKHIAQVHDGNVSVESKPGIGSKFSIYIPIT